MAMKWEKNGKRGDHYRLAFERKNTWSQKHNMVWDKLWNLNLFPQQCNRKRAQLLPDSNRNFTDFL